MVKDAQAHADDDRKRQQEIEGRNRADSLIYSTEKTLRENRDKIPEDANAAAEKALEGARKAIEEGGRERIEAAIQELMRASYRISEVLYQQATPPAPDASAPGDAGKDGGDVIDAEVVDKK